MRNAATGTNPPLCNVHVVVFAEMGRPPQGGMSAAEALVDDLLSGRAHEVTRDRVEDAIGELFGNWSMGGNIAQGYYPDIDANGRTDHSQRGNAGAGFRPPPGFRVPPGWPFPFGGGGGRQSAPPPPDPAEVELEQSIRRARQVLGFAAGEPITEDTLRARYRELARKHHSDLSGGSDEKMKDINHAKDVLEEALAHSRGEG